MCRGVSRGASLGCLTLVEFLSIRVDCRHLKRVLEQHGCSGVDGSGEMQQERTQEHKSSGAAEKRLWQRDRERGAQCG